MRAVGDFEAPAASRPRTASTRPVPPPARPASNASAHRYVGPLEEDVSGLHRRAAGGGGEGVEVALDRVADGDLLGVAGCETVRLVVDDQHRAVGAHRRAGRSSRGSGCRRRRARTATSALTVASAISSRSGESRNALTSSSAWALPSASLEALLAQGGRDALAAPARASGCGRSTRAGRGRRRPGPKRRRTSGAGEASPSHRRRPPRARRSPGPARRRSGSRSSRSPRAPSRRGRRSGREGPRAAPAAGRRRRPAPRPGSASRGAEQLGPGARPRLAHADAQPPGRIALARGGDLDLPLGGVAVEQRADQLQRRSACGRIDAPSSRRSRLKVPLRSSRRFARVAAT